MIVNSQKETLYAKAPYSYKAELQLQFNFSLTLYSRFITRTLALEVRGKSFKEKIMEATNKYRGMHGVGELQWDTALESTATQWANQLASEDKFYHSNAGDKGYSNHVQIQFCVHENRCVTVMSVCSS